MVWLRWVLCVLGVSAAACVDTNVIDCGDGSVCPSGRVCAQLASDPPQRLCVDQTQIDACDGLVDGDTCTFGAAPSACFGGLCLPTMCGNGRLEQGEVCDDGNTVTGDGMCSSDCLSNEACGNGEIDPLVLVGGERTPNEECDDGNLVSADGCSSTCMIENGAWARVGDPIIALTEPSMAYDAARKRVVLFGGSYRDGGGDQVFSNVTYEWDGTSWRSVPTPVAPPGRVNAGMVYDTAGARIVMFAGNAGDDDNALTDMWTWDGHQWKRIFAPVMPPPRTKFGMVYDADSKRIIAFGGYSSTYYDDTWAWDGVTWTDISGAVRPEPRSGHSMTYDPKRGVVVMVGGINDQTDAAYNETWELAGNAWTRTSTTTPSQFQRGAGLAYDPAEERVIAYGGVSFSPSATIATSSTWSYSGGTWTEIVNATAGPRAYMATASDPAGGVVWMFGGTDDDDTGETLTSATHRWDGASWSLMPETMSAPLRTHPSSAYDPQHRRVWLFGGAAPLVDPPRETDSLYSFDGHSWREHTWSGAGPGPRTVTSMAYDQERDELVVFGGSHAVYNPVDDDYDDVPRANETWRWNGTSWTGSTPSPSPPARMGGAMAYDPRRKVVVLFGGGIFGQGAPTMFGDTWEWNGTSWREVTTTTKPSPRAVGEMTYDARRGAVILYNGVAPHPTFFLESTNDVWAFDGTDWTKLSDPTPVGNRFNNPIAYDYTAGVITTFGGTSLGGSVFADTWTWDGMEWTQTFTLARPDGRAEFAFTPNPTGPGVLLVAGRSGDSYLSVAADTWLFSFDNGEPRERCVVVTDDDGDTLEGCADPDCWYRCAPACPPGAACDMNEPRCGDGVCNAAVEDCRICAQDCTCTPACGDSFCDSSETLATCPGDCTP